MAGVEMHGSCPEQQQLHGKIKLVEKFLLRVESTVCKDCLCHLDIILLATLEIVCDCIILHRCADHFMQAAQRKPRQKDDVH